MRTEYPYRDYRKPKLSKILQYRFRLAMRM
jgi:hypothetical protein